MLERKAAEIVQNSESEGSVYNSNVKFSKCLDEKGAFSHYVCQDILVYVCGVEGFKMSGKNVRLYKSAV